MARNQSSSVGKWLVILIVAAALFAGGAWYWRHRAADASAYQTAKVTKGELTQLVTATGTLNPVINVQVGSQVSGNIQKLFADWNSPVKANQVVAQIDPAIYNAAVMQAEGDLASAKAALELARVTAKRSQDLLDQKATPQATYDQAMAALHQAEAAVKLKEGSLAIANVNLKYCTITSPVDGIVISRNVDVGQTVAASLSAPVIFTIANDLTKMQIDTSVAEADVGNVEVGQSVDFTVDAFPTRTFHGKVIQVRNAPVTVQNVVTYDTVIEVHNDDLKLKPGMTATASIIIAHRDDAVKVSNAVLRFRMPEAPGATPSPRPSPPGGSKPGSRSGGPRGERRTERTVYVMRGDKPQPVQIKTGISDGIFTEVLSGLNEGDVVVVGVVNPQAPAQAPATNPFGPPPRRF